MTSSICRPGLFSFSFHNFLKIISIGIIALSLTSCGDEVVRTDDEYSDIAFEAHAAGDSKLALFELAEGIRNFPENADLQLLRGKIFLDLENGSAAEIAFNKAITLGYNRDFIKHELAESWLYQHNPAKVIEYLESDILEGTKDALIYEIVGRAYIASRDRTNPTLFMKNMNIAEEYIGKAFQLNPNNTRVLISKAWLLAMAGKIEEALEWLGKADSIVKDQRANLAVKGELLIRQDNTQLAQETYDRLVKKFPQYPQYKVELGYTYLLNRNFSKSREWIEPIAEIYPNHIRAQYLLANVSLMEKKYETAKQLSDAILAKSPEDLKTIIVNGASSYFLGDFENAHQKLNHFYNRTGSIPALKLLVATKLKLNEDVAALKLLEDAGQSIENQSDEELLNLVAVASAKIGKIDVALEAYKRLAERRPDSPFLRNNVGIIQIAQGNYEEGFKNLERALDDDKSDKEPGLNFYILANKALQAHQYDRAADYIEKYKKAASDNYKPWIMSAVLQSILKNKNQVRQDFDKAMAIAPDVAEVKGRYAIYENMQGNQEKALELAAQALKLDPSDVGSGKLLLPNLIKQKKFDEVRIIVDNAVNAEKISNISKIIFADYYTLLGRPQETLNIIEQLPNAVKDTSSYKIISGKAYLRNGQTQRAVAVLEEFSLTNPNNIQALKYLMQGYLLTRDQRKYQAILEKIDTLDPKDYENLFALAKLYVSTGKYDQAEKILKGLKQENQQQILQKEILLAMVETNRGNIKKALAILSSLYNKYPGNGAVSMLYARNLANDDSVDEAIDISKLWADQHEENLEVKQFLGDLYMRSGDNVNATLLYETILAKKDRANAQTKLHTHNNLAMIYLENNQVQKAAKHAQAAIDMAPNNPIIVDTFAQVLLKQGNGEKAVDQFNHALALLPENDRKNRSLFTLGKAKALILAGQKEKAEKILNRLLKDDPTFSQKSEVTQILSGL